MGAPLLNLTGVYRGLEKALEMGTFLQRGPVKNHGVSIHRELSYIQEGPGNGASLSLWVLYEGTLEGSSFPGYPEGYIEGSGDGHIFS